MVDFFLLFNYSHLFVEPKCFRPLLQTARLIRQQTGRKNSVPIEYVIFTYEYVE